MTPLEKERLKDILIDFLYDYFYNQKVKIIEGGGNKLSIHPDSKVEVDSFQGMILDQIKKSGEFSARYDLREEKTCEIISQKLFTHKDLTARLERLGIGKSDELGPIIHDSVEYLVDRSYLYRDQPVESKVGLTLKGVKHYESGSSFEEGYLQQKLLIKSDARSRASKIIAIISLVISGIVGIGGLLVGVIGVILAVYKLFSAS